MNTIQELWQKFVLFLPKDAPPEQIGEMRLSFYAGAEAFRQINWTIGSGEISEDAGVAILHGVDAELEAFADELKSEKAKRKTACTNAERVNGRPPNAHLARGVELLAEHLAETAIQSGDLAGLFEELGMVPDAPNILHFRHTETDSDTLATALAAYFSEHQDQPDADLRRDNVGAWPTPWVKDQTEQALLLVAQSMHEFLTRGRE